MGRTRKKKLFSEWQTVDTAINEGTLVAVQKEVTVYVAYYSSNIPESIMKVRRETGNVRYKVVAEKE